MTASYFVSSKLSRYLSCTEVDINIDPMNSDSSETTNQPFKYINTTKKLIPTVYDTFRNKTIKSDFYSLFCNFSAMRWAVEWSQ